MNAKPKRYGPAPTPAVAKRITNAALPSLEAAGNAAAAPALVRGKKGKTAKKKPKLPNLDPNDVTVWQETARLAREGNTKLARACDILREGLQMLVFAEFDHSTRPPTPMTGSMFRSACAEVLEAYSLETGQDWRRPMNQVVKTRAGKAEGPNARGRNVGNDGEDYAD
jgi:hypothetical protein